MFFGSQFSSVVIVYFIIVLLHSFLKTDIFPTLFPTQFTILRHDLEITPHSFRQYNSLSGEL
jgi:hypothetical protein